MKLKSFWGCLLLSLFMALAACGRSSAAANERLLVFAAASLTDALTEMAVAFEDNHPHVDVQLNFAGSSQLAAQLREGAAADLFASANPAQMEAVIAAGRIDPGQALPFLTNRLTVIVPADNPAGISAFADLARPGITLVLAVEGVPIRTYTDEIVAAMPADFRAAFYENLVSEEDNVRQIVAKIALGEGDAGIVYASDINAALARQVQQLPIPAAQNTAAVYFLAPLNDAPHPDTAARFAEFVLSADGQAILARWGFEPPPRE